MATESAPTKSTGGGGYTFADKVAAAFLAQMLKHAFPLEVGLGPIVGLHFETRESGHILDDLLLILQRGTENTRCAVSVKSNRQLTNTGFNQEFVADAWEQHRRPAGPNFDPENDLLGLTVGVIQDATFHEWRELVKQLTSTMPERMFDRLSGSGQTSAIQRAIFDSLHDPLAEGSSDPVETARFAKKIRVFSFSESSEGTYINLCAEIVLAGTLDEATKLWSRLVQLANENRGTGGYFDLPKLVRMLRPDFELRDYPDYDADWKRIETSSATNATAVRAVIGQNIQLARSAERAKISTELAAHDVIILVGESGSGKSALVAQLVSEGAYKRLLWLTAQQLSKSSQTELANTFALRHSIPELIHNSSLRGCLLVLDGFEKLEGEAPRRALEFIVAVKNAGFVGWKLIVTCQPQFAQSVQDALIEAGITETQRVDFEKPSAQEIYNAIPHLPEIRDLLARSHLQPILRNLVMLDWVLRAEIATRVSASPTTWIGETQLIHWIWERWTGAGQMHFARDSLLRALGLQEGEMLSGAVHVDTISRDQLPLLGTLEHDGLIRANGSSILFRHDLMGDWARFRGLTCAGNDALREIKTLAPVPRWGHAIRLYAQSLAEKGDALETWKAANSQLAGTSPESQVASDIFLDGLLFAANSEVLLEQVWANLISDDGLILKRLFQRLQHAASIPDFRLRLLADPKLVEQSQAWFRIPLPIYWVPALAVFSRHAKDVATHTLLAAAEACALWLRTIPVGIAGRREAALLAIELGKETQGLVAEGLRFGDKDKVVYEALLWAAQEFPDEVSEIALELSARREEPKHAIWRGIEADERRAKQHQEWLAKHPEEKKRKRIPIPSLLSPHSEGPMRAAATDGPLREVSDGFRSAVLETGALKGLSATRPDIAREVLLAVCIDEPKPMATHREMILRRDECGLADWRNGYPAAYWKGPFLLFLQDAPEHGLDAVLRLVNYATNRWLDDAVGHALTDEERRRYGVSFEIEGTTKTWMGDCNTYGWHRSCSLHAAAVESALMALERWLYTEVDGGRNVSRWLQTILGRAESLAFAGVLVSLGLKHPVVFTKELQPLLGSIYLYECQLSWALNEGHETWTIPQAGQGQVAMRMTAEWNRMPHRRFLLQDVVPWLMHQHDGTRKYLASRKPECRKVLAVRKEKPESLELLLAKLDPDSYTHTPEPDGMVRIEMRVPVHLESKINQAQEEGGFKMLALTLASRARQYLSTGNPLTANNVSGFAGDLERLAEWKPPAGDEPLAQYRLNSLAGAVAVLIIQQRTWLAQNPILEKWCMNFLRTEGAGGESEYDSPVSALDHTAESFRGEAGVAVLQESSEEWVLRLAFDGVTGFYYGSVLQAMWNAYLLRDRLGYRFDELVNVVVLWSALRRAATRESGYQANRSLLERYKRTLFRRFVSGRFHRGLISLERAGHLGRRLVTRIARRTMSEGERLARQERREYLRSERRGRKLYRDIPDLDLEVLRKGLAFLPVMSMDASPDDGQRLQEYIRELYALEMRTLPRPETGEETLEIEGTAYDFDSWVMSRVAEFISRQNSAEVARTFYRPIIELGPSARYWVEDFLQAWITRGLESSTDLVMFSRIWTEMVEYAMSLPAWQPNEGNYWARAESVVVDLMGLRDTQTNLLGQEKYRAVVSAMAPTFERWGSQWLKYGYVAAWFCRFLPTDSGQLLLSSGIKLLAGRVSSFRESDWHDHYLGPLITEVLATCWTVLRSEVEMQPSLQQAFLRILTELCARHIAEALQLRDRVSRTLNPQVQTP